MSTPVKWFTSDMAGAPVLSGTAGALIAVLDACLVTGFNTKTLTSLVVSGGVATATVAAGHQFTDQVVGLVAGATPAALNGECRITVTGASTFTFPTTAPDGTATGTITVKVAPAGWSKPYSATNKAAYCSTDVAATGLYLRVQDDATGTSSGARNALLRGYEAMTDVDTGSNPFPSAGQSSTGGVVHKSNNADSSARRWVVVADAALVYLMVEWSPSSYPSQFGATVFGDVVSYKAGDGYGCVLLVDKDEALSSPPGNLAYAFALKRLVFVSAWTCWVARSYAQLPGAVEAWGLLEGGRTENATYGHVGGSGQPYPSPVDNGLYAQAVQLCERSAAGNVLRGRLPGLLNPLHVRPLGHLATIDGVTGLEGRTLLACDAAAYEVGPGAVVGQALFDLTGPWR